MRSRQPKSTLKPTRTSSGFTLIELLVVIVILGILISLLVPAVMNAVNTANNAAISAEMQSMSQALAAFKAQYGSYPPSRVVIAEDGDYSTANLGSIDPVLAQRGLTLLRKFWPRMKFAVDGTKPSISGGWYDANGDTVKQTEPYVLSGHEAICLFLGGVPMKTQGGYAMTGFSADPANPFQSSIPPTTAGAWPSSNNRTPPMMEFRPGSLKAANNPTLPLAGQMPGYTDRYGSFFAYFSAYNGQGYDPDDVDIAEPDDAETTTAVRGGLQSSNAPTSIRKITTRTDLVSSQSPNPYLSDSPLPVDGAGAIVLADKRPKAYHNASTFQIISAGKDGRYGIGGQWSQKAEEPLPFYASANASATGMTLGKAVRQAERDNVTSFSGGKLD